MQKPRVVILSAFLSPFRSGAEACVEEVTARLADRFDMTIVTAKLTPHPNPCLPAGRLSPGGEGISVVRVGLGRSFDKWLFPFLAPLTVRRLQPDIVHAVLETFAGAALALCRFAYPRARRILTLQTTNRSFLKCPIIRSAHRVAAISSVLVEAAKVCGREATLIPNGVDYSAIRKACAQHPKVPGRILYVGRLEHMKGVDTLLTVFTDVVQKFPEAQLRIVGDGSIRSLLIAHCSSLVQQGKVNFVGYVPVPEIYKEFAEAEIFCALPRSEAMGNVFLEAQAAGCAVVGARVGGVPDIILHGKTGILVPSDDTAATTIAILSLLKDQELQEKLSVDAVEHAVKYDWPKVVEKYVAQYEFVLQGSSRAR